MDVLTAIEKRREITRFKPEPVPPEALDKLIRALHLAPSGNNLPSREFVIVENREMLLALAETPPYMRWLRETAGAAVIFAAPEVSKYWLQDATIAGAFLWLAATSLGLGAAWGAVYHSEDAEESRRREDHVRRTLGIPGSYRVVAILGYGWPAADPAPKEPIPKERVFHLERYGGRP